MLGCLETVWLGLLYGGGARCRDGGHSSLGGDRPDPRCCALSPQRHCGLVAPGHRAARHRAHACGHPSPQRRVLGCSGCVRRRPVAALPGPHSQRLRDAGQSRDQRRHQGLCDPFAPAHGHDRLRGRHGQSVEQRLRRVPPSIVWPPLGRGVRSVLSGWGARAHDLQRRHCPAVEPCHRPVHASVTGPSRCRVQRCLLPGR
mmetsp:Transcript_35801/g.99224  ORF Transcript_35801/g.99224 Transcript_35801/m.99224 type:complete len:201 (-) Transcript_35801:979-1581(-)